MEIIMLVLFLLMLGILWWKRFVWNDLVRIAKSQFQTPRTYLTPRSIEECERLLRYPSLDLLNQPSRASPAVYFAETMERLMSNPSIREAQALIDLMEQNELIQSSMDAHRFAQYCRQDLVVHDLPANSLSQCIACLHKYAASTEIAQTIQYLFETTQIVKTFELKQQVEERISLFYLIYHEIRSTTCREAILTHFQHQTTRLLATSNYKRPVKVISDIDDTLFAMLFDTRYPTLTVYPGVHQFHQELKQTPKDRIVFLTARPEILRSRSIRELALCGFTHCTLLMSRLTTMVGGPRRIAAGKLENFAKYHRLFREYTFIFVGDNGQGDIDLGQLLLESVEQYNVMAVLIHDVIRNYTRPPNSSNNYQYPDPTKPLSPYRHQDCKRYGIHLFRSYISATLQLYHLQVVSVHAIWRVIEKTTLAFRKIEFETSDQKENFGLEVANEIVEVMNVVPDAIPVDWQQIVGDQVYRMIENVLNQSNQRLTSSIIV